MLPQLLELEWLKEAATLADTDALLQGEEPDALVLADALLDVDYRRWLANWKKRHPRVACVILAHSADPRAATALVEAGFQAYVPKAASLRTLAAAILLAVSGETFLPGSVMQAMKRANDHCAKDLTDRERSVLYSASSGASNKQIAWDLQVAENTVKTHLSSAFKKLGVTNRVQALQETMACRACSRPCFVEVGPRTFEQVRALKDD